MKSSACASGMLSLRLIHRPAAERANRGAVMSRLALVGVTAGLIFSLNPSLAADGAGKESLSLENFPIYWIQDRPAQDDFLSPESGPGPVVSEPGHPYVPN